MRATLAFLLCVVLGVAAARTLHSMPGSDCMSLPPEHQAKCCADKLNAGIDDQSCLSLPGFGCASLGPNKAACCANKAAKHVRDPACPPLAPCANDFFALPQDPKTNSNQAILPYSASDKTAADRYCQARGYAAAGAVLPVTLPPPLTPQGPNAAVGVVECMKAGCAPMQPDAAGNIGTGNSGSGNVGNNNSGSGNYGNRNSGQSNRGDDNSGSSNWGNHNSGSNHVGNNLSG